MASGTRDLLTTADAAQALGVSEVRVRKLCRDGRLGTLFGDRWLITPEELKAFKKLPRPPGRPKDG